MNLENVLTALKYSINRDLANLDDSVLEDQETQKILIAHFAEQEARSDLVKLIRIPLLMQKYLNLNLEDKEVLDSLRCRGESYLKGEVGSKSLKGNTQNEMLAPAKNPVEVRLLYHDIAISNALQKMVKSYIELQPKRKKRFIHLSSFLLSYDIFTGEMVQSKSKKNGYKRKRTPQGRKVHRYWFDNFYNVSFEKWVMGMVPADLFSQLNEFPFYEKNPLNLEDVVHAYIKHKLTSRCGPVSLKGFLQYYDLRSGEKLITVKDRERHRKSNPEGSKFYNKYAIESRNSEISFEEWLKTKISEKLFKQLMEMPFYKKKIFSLGEVVKRYIEVQPSSQNGPVPLANFFNRYDLVSGKTLNLRNKNAYQRGLRFYEQYRKERKDNEVIFEEWLKANISKKLFDELMQTPFYTKEEIILEEAVCSYIKYTPRSKIGPVSFNNYLRFYDLKTGEQVHGIKSGVMKKWGETQGASFRTQYETDRKQYRKIHYKDLSMINWLRDKIPNNYYRKLLQTPFYQQEKRTLEKAVEDYIKFQPKTKIGFVSFTNFLVSYDLDTGERLILSNSGDRKIIRQPQGTRFHQKFMKEKSKRTLIMEEWVRENIPRIVYNRMMQTLYYRNSGEKNDP